MQGNTKRGTALVVRALGVGVVLSAFCLTMLAGAANAADAEATNEEYALLVLANQARSEPTAFGYDHPVVPPLAWNDALARVARAHSTDMAQNGCYQHDSCSGQTWWKRIQSYYANWTGLAENIIAVGDTPEQLHAGWMASTGHRENILAGGLFEFGAGLAVGPGGFGQIAFGTEDFGVRGLPSLRSLPAVPAGAVFPRTGTNQQRRLAANFYDYDGPPQSVRALVGASCVELALETGAAAHGTYSATRSFQGQGCVPLVFEAVKGDGTRHRFPTQGAILVAAGGADCAQRSAEAPTQDCGGPVVAPSPIPSPVPTATPAPTDGPDGAALRKLRVVLMPGPKNASKGQVTIVATLPPMPDFNPSGLPIRLSVRFSPGDWTRELPESCDGELCLELNKKGNVYRAQYGKNGAHLSFTRDKKGLWTLRYWSRGETLGRLASGPVTLAIEVGDLVVSGDGAGEIKKDKLIVE